jgi:hypothetical protein
MLDKAAQEAPAPAAADGTAAAHVGSPGVVDGSSVDESSGSPLLGGLFSPDYRYTDRISQHVSSPHGFNDAASHGGSSRSTSSVASIKRKISRAQELAHLERAMAEKERAREMELAEKERRRDEEELARVRRLLEMEEQLLDAEEEDEFASFSPTIPDARSQAMSPRNDVTQHQSASVGTPPHESELVSRITDALQVQNNLPKPELPSFDGCPKDFHRFMHTFETVVEQLSINSRAKLTFLIQHCTGDARRCIEDCVLLPSDVAYDEAKRMLKEQFGRPWMVADEFLQKLTEGPSIRNHDQKALR